MTVVLIDFSFYIERHRDPPLAAASISIRYREDAWLGVPDAGFGYRYAPATTTATTGPAAACCRRGGSVIGAYLYLYVL